MISFAIASDHAGYTLKEVCKTVLTAHGSEVEDLGPNGSASVDYPDYAQVLCEWMKEGKDRRGVLICGSGIGMSIAANRYKHVRAALCHTVEQAMLTRQHNDANVLVLGARMVSEAEAREILHAFLTTEFEGGRHAARVAKLG